MFHSVTIRANISMIYIFLKITLIMKIFVDVCEKLKTWSSILAIITQHSHSVRFQICVTFTVTTTRSVSMFTNQNLVNNGISYLRSIGSRVETGVNTRTAAKNSGTSVINTVSGNKRL